MMEGVLQPFTDKLKTVQFNPPKIPIISNLTGTWLTDAEANSPQYWANHLRQTVRFNQGMRELSQESQRLFLEIGAGNTLGIFSQQPIFSSLRHPKQEQSDATFILHTLGKLWLNGVKINWDKVYQNQSYYRIPLPTYPFERKRYWVDKNITLPSENKVIKTDLSDWFYTPSWERDLLPQTKEIGQLGRNCWLIFLDTQGVGVSLAEKLTSLGQDVFTVAIGETFTELEYRAFALHPEQKEGYGDLLEDLALRELDPNYIIYCWGITEDNDTQQDVRFTSLLYLIQGLEKHKMTSGQLTVITNNLFNVIGNELKQPEKASLSGLCKVRR
jgi:acyl transferase domain-containing protein